MALGGFMGTDPAITTATFARDVAAGRVRFVLVDSSVLDGAGGFGGRGGFRGFGPGGGRGGGIGSTGADRRGVIEAVTAACTAVTVESTAGALPSAYSGSIYDCAGRADAILAASS
jgi:hypothetical protein